MMAMESVPLVGSERSGAFGYECRRCQHCCHEKRIQLNPYEIARLANALGLSTSEFSRRWTVDGAGTELGRDDATGACVFLGERGCSVHQDRPLVCRLYPLGRHVDSGGNERFSVLDSHPRSEGRFLPSGDISAYLTRQQADRFITAADEYFSWCCRAIDRLGPEPDGGGAESGDPDDARARLDMDTAIGRHCATTNTAEPEDIELRKSLHLRILNDLLNPATEALT